MDFHNPTWLKQEILVCLLKRFVDLGFQVFRSRLVRTDGDLVSVSVITGPRPVICPLLR